MEAPAVYVTKASARKARLAGRGELPKNVTMIVTRNREYFYFQLDRGTPNEGPRIRLSNPWSAVEIAKAYSLSAGAEDEYDWKSQLQSAYVSAKQRCRKNGREFGLDLQHLANLLNKQGHRCAVSGIPFQGSGYNDSHMKPFAISLDRVDCSRGYSKDNVRLVCRIVNFALGEWGLPALERLSVAMAAQIRKRDFSEPVL